MDKFKIDPQLKSNYDSFYEDGESYWRKIGAIEKANNIIKLCSSLSITSMIEVGAGEGSILERLSKLKFTESFCAIEISSSGVEAIKAKKIPRLDECSQFDGYNIPFEDERFDLAVLSHVVEHVEHPRQLINEALRVSKYVFIEVPLEDSIRLPNDFTPDGTGHINFYSPKTIRSLIQTCGLKVIGELITNRSKKGHVYQNPRTGAVRFHVKNILLNMSPSLASKIFTYHHSLICERGTELKNKM